MTQHHTEARAHILNRIRQSLQVSAKDQGRSETVEARIRTHQANLIPKIADQSRADLLDNFQTLLEGQGTTVIQLESLENIPKTIADYLRGHNLPLSLRHGADTLISRIPWEAETAIDRQTGKAQAEDHTSLSVAFLGIGETGTLLMLSGADNPTTLNFLPETHIILLPESKLAASYESAWQEMRNTFGDRTMPRTVNWISGPSRTADIEQTLIQGAHGPRRLCVMIIKNE